MSKKVIIVGGVAGGATAAARLRRLDESLEIIVFEKGEYVSFANCGLPYHIGEVIPERGSLLVTTKEALWDRFRIQVRNLSEVTGVDTSHKTVRVNSRDKGEYSESYDYLVLSPGAMPMKPPIPGINHERILSLRNIPDTDKIKQQVDGGIKSALVIGGGFIGIEVAENMVERGVNVTLVEAVPHILAPLDTEIAMIVEKELRDYGIHLVLGDGVASFQGDDKKVTTTLASGKTFESDIVVAAIGVRPDTAFLKDSGIELNERGYIKTNPDLSTNVPGVYAAGDAIQVIDYVTKAPATIALAGPANRQGRIIADNICGMNKTYKGSLGTSILKVFDMTAASTGNNERQLVRGGIEYKAFYLHPQSHATYYPGAMQMTAKILTDKAGKLLGAQAVGYDGVDKLIDVFATTIKFGGTVDDLAELDLAYAPPYSSAKSPANVAGFIAQDYFENLVESKTFSEFDQTFDPATDVLLDVREVIEVENGALKNSVNIPLNGLRDKISGLDKSKNYWVYCQIGLSGYIGARILTQNGFTAYNLAGGYRLKSLGEVTETVEKTKADKGTPHKGPQLATHEDGTAVLEPTKPPVNQEPAKVIKVNACGLSCPGPLLKTKEGMDSINPGEILNVKASDPGYYEDVKAWARRTGTEIVSLTKEKGIIDAKLRKVDFACAVPDTTVNVCEPKNKTLVVFSGELDKAIASFIIANGAIAMGGKVTMFFTFWGLNILRKSVPPKVKKTPLEKIFGQMMPAGSKKLALSKMHMGGFGPKIIRKVMSANNVDSLETLMSSAQKMGVELVACQMSMDLLGIKREELIDGVKLGGVGYYLGEAEEATVNLFI